VFAAYRELGGTSYVPVALPQGPRFGTMIVIPRASLVRFRVQ